METIILSRNFSTKTDPLRCPCCGGLLWEPEGRSGAFIRRVQILRDIMGIAFYISEGGFYRCSFYNDTLPDSAKDSQHLLSLAMDISRRGWCGATRWKFRFRAMQLGLSVGQYDTFYHVDFRKGEPVEF